MANRRFKRPKPIGRSGSYPSATSERESGREKYFLDRAASGALSRPSASSVRKGEARWQSLGPFNFSGRLTSIVVDPRDHRRLLVGSAAGGVWRSRDAGRSWDYVWPEHECQNIGSLAFDPTNPDVVYCGTGEANLSLDSYPGVGLFRSDDFGTTWTFLEAQSGMPDPLRIASIAVDPSDPSVIWLGSVAHSDEHSTLLCRLDLSSMSLSEAHGIGLYPSYNCHSVLFHPTEPGLMFATIDARGALNGIWRSPDRGENWEHLSCGLPPNEMFGRTSLAICPGEPDVIWAYASDRHAKVLGVFRTQNRGDHWFSVGGGHFDRERHANYNNCIVVHPNLPDFAVCGGVNLHLTTDGGRNWHEITEWDRERGDPRYAHADHHALAMPKGDLIYDCNDGGLDYCDDANPHSEAKWENRSLGLVTTMFYDIDVAPSHGTLYGGGTQDNGTLIHNFGAPDGEFVQAIGGDGGWMLFDPFDPNRIFGSFQHMNLKRHTEGSGWSTVTPSEATEEERQAVWLSVMAMDCHEHSTDPRTVFAGSNRVWKTIDDGENWRAVSRDFDGSPLTALDVSSANPLWVYAATEEGGVHRSMDAGNSWSENLAGPAIPRKLITGIQAHPRDFLHVVLTMAAVPPVAPWGAYDAKKKEFVYAPYSHVYVSLNGGESWDTADLLGQSPDVPHHGLAFETREPYRVFVAADIGVWAGAWDERRRTYLWEDFTRNLPLVMVTDVVYHELTHSLTVATYGRGIWRLDLRAKPKRK